MRWSVKVCPRVLPEQQPAGVIPACDLSSVLGHLPEGVAGYRLRVVRPWLVPVVDNPLEGRCGVGAARARVVLVKSVRQIDERRLLKHISEKVGGRGRRWRIGLT